MFASAAFVTDSDGRKRNLAANSVEDAYFGTEPVICGRYTIRKGRGETTTTAPVAVAVYFTQDAANPVFEGTRADAADYLAKNL